MEKVWNITGTFHGSIICAKTEGDARRAFHAAWGGESIIVAKDITNYRLNNL